MTDKTAAPQNPATENPEPQSPPQGDGFTTVTLNQPITRGDTAIERLNLRKPKAGEMRGLSLSDLIDLDISAILKVIPRISEPVLTDEECSDLDLADLTEIGGAIRGFFMTKAERKMLDTAIEEMKLKG